MVAWSERLVFYTGLVAVIAALMIAEYAWRRSRGQDAATRSAFRIFYMFTAAYLVFGVSYFYLWISTVFEIPYFRYIHASAILLGLELILLAVLAAAGRARRYLGPTLVWMVFVWFLTSSMCCIGWYHCIF